MRIRKGGRDGSRRCEVGSRFSLTGKVLFTVSARCRVTCLQGRPLRFERHAVREDSLNAVSDVVVLG
jgi:hypothetical protein